MKKQQGFIIGIMIFIAILITAFISLPKAYFRHKPACNNSVENKLFQPASSFSPYYQKEVLHILKINKAGDFRYFFKTFLQQGETTYMVVNLRNSAYCFDAIMLVDKWDKLGGMRQTNGLSYPEELYEPGMENRRQKRERRNCLPGYVPIID